MNQYGYGGLSLDMFKMAPLLPKTPDEAILLSNLYQVQSAVAKLKAQQELALRLYNHSQPTYIPSSMPCSMTSSMTSSITSSPSMSPTRTDSISPLPFYQKSAFSPVEKATHHRPNHPYRRKRRSEDQPELRKSKPMKKPTSHQKEEKKTFLDLYEAYGVIGVGGGGMVYAGRRITDKLPVAIKRVMREKVKRWEKVQGHTVPQEIALMLR